jgi:hypothetical protein
MRIGSGRMHWPELLEWFLRIAPTAGIHSAKWELLGARRRIFPG